VLISVSNLQCSSHCCSVSTACLQADLPVRIGFVVVAVRKYRQQKECLAAVNFINE
jgi:hypothetical protein